MKRILWLSHFVIGALVALSAPAMVADTGNEPSAFLASKGLTLMGRTWWLRAELELRDRLDLLDAQEKRATQAQKKVDALIDKNETARLGLVTAITKQSQLQDAIAAASGGAKTQLLAESKLQTALIEQLKPQYVEGKLLAESSAGRGPIIELINARNELALNLFWLRSRAAELSKQMSGLTDDPRVAKALTASDTQLTPLKDTYLDEGRLARLEALALGGRTPVYRDSGFYRFSALVNQSLPVTFSFRESSDPLVLPQSVAESLGLKYDPAKTTQFTASDRRKLSVCKTRLAELRVGKIAWTSVEAIILPAEGENLGAQLGPQSLAGYRATIDSNLLRLNIEPAR